MLVNALEWEQEPDQPQGDQALLSLLRVSISLQLCLKLGHWHVAATLGREIHEKGKNRALINNYLLAFAELFNCYCFLVFEVWSWTCAALRDFFVIGFLTESLGSKGNMTSAVCGA